MYELYGDDVQFFVVYIAEAHAIDSVWPFTQKGMPLVQEPVTTEERMEVCGKCVVAIEIKQIPTLVDKIDDKVNKAYNAWPDRLALVGKDGKLSYYGGPGPFKFSPDEMEAAIRKELGLPGDKATPAEVEKRKKAAASAANTGK